MAATSVYLFINTPFSTNLLRCFNISHAVWGNDQVCYDHITSHHITSQSPATRDVAWMTYFFRDVLPQAGCGPWLNGLPLSGLMRLVSREAFITSYHITSHRIITSHHITKSRDTGRVMNDVFFRDVLPQAGCMYIHWWRLNGRNVCISLYKYTIFYKSTSLFQYFTCCVREWSSLLWSHHITSHHKVPRHGTWHEWRIFSWRSPAGWVHVYT